MNAEKQRSRDTQRKIFMDGKSKNKNTRCTKDTKGTKGKSSGF